MANKSIIDKVFKKLMAMSGDDLIHALDNHSTGDIAAALQELNAFDVGLIENRSIIELENKSLGDVTLQSFPNTNLAEPIYKISAENLSYIINFNFGLPISGLSTTPETNTFSNFEENLKLSESKAIEQSSNTWTTQKDLKWAA
jgi:hypothetical protein